MRSHAGDPPIKDVSCKASQPLVELISQNSIFCVMDRIAMMHSERPPTTHPIDYSMQPSSSAGPTLTGSMYPSFSAHPSSHPTAMPSVSPSSSPTNVATETPSVSIEPSNMPSSSPSTSSEPSTAVSFDSCENVIHFNIVSHHLISCQYINVSSIYSPQGIHLLQAYHPLIQVKARVYP